MVVPALLLALAGCSLVPTPGSAPVTGGTRPTTRHWGTSSARTPSPRSNWHRTPQRRPSRCPSTERPRSGASRWPPRRTGVPPMSSPGPPHSRAGPWLIIPIDLVTQRAGRPIVLPGTGATHAVAVTHDGRTVLAAVGTTIVPVDPATRAVGTPLDLGPGRTVYGMALSPTSPVLYTLVTGPGDPCRHRHGTGRGADLHRARRVVGVVPPRRGGQCRRVHRLRRRAGWERLRRSAHPDLDGHGRTVGTVTGFDQFGIADPAALALTADGATALVADSADNWVVPVPVGRLGTPSDPVRLPTGASAAAGTDHPSDIVTGPGTTGVFVVTGLDTVLPFLPAAGAFGTAIRVCAGASSMAVSGG